MNSEILDTSLKSDCELALHLVLVHPFGPLNFEVYCSTSIKALQRLHSKVAFTNLGLMAELLTRIPLVHIRLICHL